MKKRGIRKLLLRKETLGSLTARDIGGAAQVANTGTDKTATVLSIDLPCLTPSAFFTDCHSCHPCQIAATKF